MSVPDSTITERLARNKSGNTIHRSTCVAVKPDAVGWRWAENNPDEDWKTTAPWLKQCQRCMPPSPLNANALSREQQP